MAIIKCKACGGDLIIQGEDTVAECEFCGVKQTLPKANEEGLQNLFNRANALRLRCEFDKAEQLYEKILQEDDAEPEAHWGIVLCRYGIEYVEDPGTYKRIPTCHRTSYDAVLADADYLAAVRYADANQKALYEAEARAIDEIQKNILSIVKDEKPFDVFICYKETDENGKRTIDSSIANDIYYQLTEEGYKVFYAAITLEDKLGREYEPYIFAALNSAKVMLVIGTKPEYFTAPWVKNEWGRFLKLMKTDRHKLLIPCYRDMDAYELPEEFARLQAQDMGRIGFINDVVRGIQKVIHRDEPKPEPVHSTVTPAATAGATTPLLRRAFLFLEDRDWASADEYCEKVLDIDPENAQAYLGKLMAEVRVKFPEQLENVTVPLDDNNNFNKALRFGDESLRRTLKGYSTAVNARIENQRITRQREEEDRRRREAEERRIREEREAEERRRREAREAEDRRRQAEQKAKEEAERKKQEEATRQQEAERQARLAAERKKRQEEQEKLIQKHKNLRTIWRWIMLVCIIAGGLNIKTLESDGYPVSHIAAMFGVLFYPMLFASLALRKGKWGDTPNKAIAIVTGLFCVMISFAGVALLSTGDAIAGAFVVIGCIASLVCVIVRRKI